MKSKHFCNGKDIAMGMNKQATNGEKNISKHVADKGHIFRRYKELLKLNKNKNSICKRAEELRDTSPKNIQMAISQLKDSTLFIIRKIKIIR